MRGLSETYITNLKNGFLSGITSRVIKDKDLDLQIRENYINIYFKGNSLLKLNEVSESQYRPEIHPKFLKDLELPDLIDSESSKQFMNLIPTLKENIILHGASSLEVEYEQLLVRANNNELRNNSEYFIVDRQLVMPGRDRIDLSAIFWKWKGRRRGQEVPLCFIEIKFALNVEIQRVHDQLNRYYRAISDRTEFVAIEAERVFKQKLELGLFEQPADRIEAMKTLKVSQDPKEYQYVLILIDYNPYSRLLDLDRFQHLPFADRLSIFHAGFAMWQKNFETV